MKTEVKKIEANKREISIEADQDIVKNKFDEVLAKIGKEAKVPGFRPGNAPRDILEKNFSQVAHEMVLKELVPDLYNQAIEKEGLDVIELPNIYDVKLEKDFLSFKAKVELWPEVLIKDYKGIKIDYRKPAVSTDEIKRSLDSLKESRKLASLDDNFAKGLGYPNLKELESALERQIYLQKENAQRQKIEQEIVESISKELDIKLPKVLVDRYLADLVRQTKLDLALKGIPREKIDEKEQEFAKDLLPDAERQVRIYLCLAAVAKKENIALDEHMPHQVMEFLLREAHWNIQEA